MPHRSSGGDAESDRRAFRRFRASEVPTLTVSTGRSPVADILDISQGGILLETSARLTPADREMVVLHGCATTKVVGRVQRVEITRLNPSLVYRAAVRFARPIFLDALTRDPATEPCEHEHAERGLRHTFSECVHSLSDVHAVHVSSLVKTHPGTEAVHFAIPVSIHGEGRLLQVFFRAGAVPTASEFAQLRELARMASELPDLDVALACRCHTVLPDLPGISEIVG